jgi:RNA polymerase sigma factor (sigma-70 family)
MLMMDGDPESTAGPGPSVEDVHELSRRVAFKYSPRCPVDDVAQDVVERWLRQTESPENWRGWVARVTRNRIHDLMAGDRGGREVPVADDSAEYVFLGRAIYGPSATVIERERLREMLGGLAPAECRVLVASLDGYANGEIADMLGYASPEAVATILSKAKARIRKAVPDVNFALLPQRMYDI